MKTEYYYHYRNLHQEGVRDATVAALNTPKGFFCGVALCSEKDQFCRRIGRELALERANGWYCFTPEMPDVKEVENHRELREVVTRVLESVLLDKHLGLPVEIR